MKNTNIKQKVKSKTQNRKVRTVEVRDPTPFRDVGGIVGKSVGGMFGSSSIGSGVGKWLGTGIGAIFGSGDYTLAGAAPAYNVLANGSQIPKFSSSRQTNVVCHREYLGDIAGTTNFNVLSYPINPGSSTTFPWLSTVAQNYQQYKIHGMIFEFRSLITDFVTSGSPGVVVMATNYNSDDAAYQTKQEMENAEFAMSVKPTLSLIHGIECADNQTFAPIKFVRDGSINAGEDAKTYDLGNFMLATQGNPLQNLGELWVSYCVEFFKPILPEVTAIETRSGHVQRAAVTAASPFGTVQTSSVGNVALTLSSTTISFAGIIGQKYLVSVNWIGINGARTVPGFSSVGVSFVSYFADASTSQSLPIAATAETNQAFNAVVVCIVSGTVLITANGAGVFPVGTTADITVASLSTSV